MKTVSLTYHDAVKHNNFDQSGFVSKGANLYKFDIDELKEHFEAIASSNSIPTSINNFLSNPTAKNKSLFLTFDDGGISAITHIAPLLEKFGWVGHFFITANRINSKGFVNDKHIRELKKRGHIIGSHSWSHPQRMSHCSISELEKEWNQSIERLSDILDESVNIASVPGGYFSKYIAKVASGCGIRALFTSEPIKQVEQIDNCLVFGRYMLKNSMSPQISKQLASNKLSYHQLNQFLLWNTKKTLKLLCGKHYLSLRKHLIDKVL